jgi:5,10-methylenetetrahydromethanopterin reductase
MRIGVSFDGFLPFWETVELAQRAAEAGADGLWMAEHLGYRQSLVCCTAFLLQAPNAVVVPTAVSPFMWHPMAIAMALTSMDEAAPGRAAIALGTGNPMFLHENGIAIEKPVRVMREFVEAVRGLLTGDAVEYQGETLQLAGARMMFTPTATIPIYVAAMGEQMLKLTGRIGDGIVLSAGLSADYARRSLGLVADGTRNAGRDYDTLRKAAYIYTAVSDDGKSAITALRSKLAWVMRNKFITANVEASGIDIDLEAIRAAIAKRDMDEATRLVPEEAVAAFACGGTLADCRRRLEEYVAAGVEEPVLVLVGDGAEREKPLALIKELTGELPARSINATATT